MFIDAGKPETFTAEIERAVVQYIEALPQDVIRKISNNEIQSNVNVRCYIEDYMAPFSVRTEILYADVLRIMEEYDLVCFHATKLLSAANIYSVGLNINNWDRYSARMRKIFNEINLSGDSLNKAMEFIEHEYKYKYFNRDRSAQLCFYSNLSLTHKGKYDQFCENVGGELARRALRSKMPKVFQALKRNGNAVIIKFKLPFTDVSYYDRSSIAYHFISKIAARHFWNYDYSIDFAGSTSVDVPPENILEVIPYTEEVNYS